MLYFVAVGGHNFFHFTIKSVCYLERFFLLLFSLFFLLQEGIGGARICCVTSHGKTVVRDNNFAQGKEDVASCRRLLVGAIPPR